MRVLITGGAGVIGSHLTHLLLRSGYSVRVPGSLAPQVLGFERHRPRCHPDDAELARKRRRHQARRAEQAQGIQRKPTFYAEHNARQFMGGRIFVERSLV
jgi:nucleoside-diphosphate-sugar epimerase